MNQFETTEIMIDKIVGAVDPGDSPYLEQLKQSIERDGLLHPIVVRRLSDGGFAMVAGNHRLAACKANGNCSIDARIAVEESSNFSIRRTIAENLFRKDISRHDRAEMLLQWKEIYESENPEVRRGYAGALAKHKLPKVENPAEPFVDVVKKTTGLGKSQAFQDLADAKLLRSFADDERLALNAFDLPTEDRLTLAKAAPEVRRAAILQMVTGDPPEWVMQNLDKCDPEVGKEHIELNAEDERSQNDDTFLGLCPARPGDDPKNFDTDAILYKRGAKAIQEFRKAMKDFMQDAKLDKASGPFYRAIKRVIEAEHPRSWKICGECSRLDADFNGKKCPSCYGAKYSIGR